MTREQKRRQAQLLLDHGETLTATARVLGMSRCGLKYLLDPDYHHPRGGKGSAYQRRKAEASFLARLAEIPPDTRTASQMLMGEPIYERSALYQKTMGAGVN